MASPRANLSIIVPVYNCEPYLIELFGKLFLGGLRKNRPADAELIIIDDGSPMERETRALAQEASAWIPVVYHRNARNLGYVRSTNEGMRRAGGEFLLLCNSDTRLTRGAVGSLMTALGSAKDIGMAGPVTNNPYSSGLQWSGRMPPLKSFSDEEFERIENFGKVVSERTDELRTARWLVGFCVLMRRQLIDLVGYLDEAFGLGYQEEVDYGIRVRQEGWRIVVAPNAFVFHGGLKTSRAGPLGGSQTMRTRPLRMFWNLLRNTVYIVHKHGWKELRKPQGMVP